ncbi:MAG: dihydropteroate synthase, partial [Candidatus Methanomethylophilaceae archaeon]
PGIGFGKTGAQNAEIMQSAYYFRGDHPVLIGSSRKRFLTAALGSNDDAASAKAAAIAADGGANIVRVHNVKATKDALYRKR